MARKMVQLDNLKRLHMDMRRMEIKQQRFTYRIDKRASFEVFFSVRCKPYELSLTEKGGTVFLLFEVTDDHEVWAKFDPEDYKSLSRLLNTSENSWKPLMPSDFLLEFNDNIPTEASSKKIPTEADICRMRHDLPDRDAPYFWYWKPMDPMGKQARNMDKTRVILGEDAAAFSERQNVSSCWTPDIRKAKDWRKATNKIV